MFSFPVLIGDIGGTNSRFAIIEHADADMINFAPTKNVNYGSIQEVIEQSVYAHTDLRPKTLILAVAGPTGDISGIKLTNCPWEIDAQRLIEELDMVEALAISDFEAQALAAIATDRDWHTLIKDGAIQDKSARCVLGPGTGLGMAGMIFSDGAWSIIPGEGGFVDIGARTKRDRAIFDQAFGEDERPAAELFLSGRGLVNLYNAIAAASGSNKRLDDAAIVSQAYQSGEDEIATETMEKFATYLGRYASDAGLIYLARGGVFLTGGVAQKLEAVLKLPYFNAAFLDKEPYPDIVGAMPVYLMTEPLIALHGLAAFAKEPELFRITRQGRHWVNHADNK